MNFKNSLFQVCYDGVINKYTGQLRGVVGGGVIYTIFINIFICRYVLTILITIGAALLIGQMILLRYMWICKYTVFQSLLTKKRYNNCLYTFMCTYLLDFLYNFHDENKRGKIIISQIVIDSKEKYLLLFIKKLFGIFNFTIRIL